MCFVMSLGQLNGHPALSTPDVLIAPIDLVSLSLSLPSLSRGRFYNLQMSNQGRGDPQESKILSKIPFKRCDKWSTLTCRAKVSPPITIPAPPTRPVPTGPRGERGSEGPLIDSTSKFEVNLDDRV